MKLSHTQRLVAIGDVNTGWKKRGNLDLVGAKARARKYTQKRVEARQKHLPDFHNDK